MPGRALVTFDVPGVGHSPLPRRPYRLATIVRLAARLLDHYGHDRCDVLGISWGGAVAQQFARSEAGRCRRLVLCATAPGLMVPAHPRVLVKLASPRRFISAEYARRVSADIYGGDFRRDPALAALAFQHIRWQSRLGYYLQMAATAGWTSLPWLWALEQRTLVMAGADDPIAPLPNARLLRWLIPHAELTVLDCGHLFLLTRPDQSARAIEEFLDRP
jgi:poly(3-hydroxyalkanoate) depolymerase